MYVPFIVAVCVYGFSNVSALSLFVCLPLLYSPCKCVCLQKIQWFMQMFAVYIHIKRMRISTSIIARLGLCAFIFECLSVYK